MLVIRLQRTGRRGHAMFRLVVQDSHRSPTSGKIVAYLGHYDPHNKTTSLDKEKAQTFLKNGAQPSGRASRILKAEGLKLPSWVVLKPSKKKTIRHPEKRRSTAPEPTKTNEQPADQPATDDQAEIKDNEPAEAETASEPEAQTSEVAESPEASSPAEATEVTAEPEAKTTDQVAEATETAAAEDQATDEESK